MSDQELSNERFSLDSQYGVSTLAAVIRQSADAELADSIDSIVTAILNSAAGHKLDAAYGGSWGDGGASQQMSQLQAFLDGVAFGVAEHKSMTYGALLKSIELSKDEEYQEYQRLKAKFGGK